MTVQEAYRRLRAQLGALYDEQEAGNIANLVMEHLTGWKNSERILNSTVLLPAVQQQELETYSRELLTHKPLQYVLHEAWFYGIKLYVDENVLIPRPETEELVDWLLDDTRKTRITTHTDTALHPLRILDIGTGSGCIPLAIKKHLPAADVYSIDTSAAALRVAEKNAGIQKASIRFAQLDILAPDMLNGLPVFDTIISNPPYIPLKDEKEMAANVLQYEPRLALFVNDEDPLLFYKAIAELAKTKLAAHGNIYLEIHEEQAGPMQALYRQYGFSSLAVRKDMQEKYRMLKAQL